MQMISINFLSIVISSFILICVIRRFLKKYSFVISKLILLFASYLIIITIDYKCALILMALTLSTYLFSGKKYYVCGIIIDCLCLGIFKYLNFFYESFANLFDFEYQVVDIILPLGISFYIFNSISYLVDVNKGKTGKRDIIDVALFLSFFPKFISGPIQKSSDFFSQLDEKAEIGEGTFSNGIQIFFFGLFKKIVLADRLSVFVDQVYDSPLAFGSITVFLATVAYSLQIYFDFSGYSDMAIGIGNIFGFDFPRNFNLPYLSHNVTEFWKRWHITLSEWLQEYLYIPLGGNRKGKIRGYINLLLTMLIGGFWHGANWTYILWGGLHGLALILHKLWMTKTKSNEKNHCVISNIFSIFSTFLFTNFSWIFFRAETVKKAFEIIKSIVNFRTGLEQPYTWLFIGLIFLMLNSFALVSKSSLQLPIRKKNTSSVNEHYLILDLNSFKNIVLLFVFIGLIFSLAYTGGSPFIYGKY